MLRKLTKIWPEYYSCVIVSELFFNFVISKLFYGNLWKQARAVKKLRIDEIKNWLRNNYTTVIFRSDFCQFTQNRRFRGLFQNTLTAITSSISGVRRSSSDSRNLSSTPFRNMPLETQITIIEKNIISWPQTDSTWCLNNNPLLRVLVWLRFFHASTWWQKVPGTIILFLFDAVLLQEGIEFYGSKDFIGANSVISAFSTSHSALLSSLFFLMRSATELLIHLL